MRLDSNIKQTIVIDVLWTVSIHGFLKPRIQIKPVNLNGVKITYVTGFNGRYIYDNKIAKDTIIEITRSGDVIPYITKIVKSSPEASMPDIPYEWNKTGVDIYTNMDKDGRCVKLITSFFNKLGIKFVAEESVRKIYNHGIDTIIKIIYAKREDFHKIDGFGKISADRIYDNIHDGLQNVSIANILGSSGVFGFGLVEKKFVNYLNIYLICWKNTRLFQQVNYIH